jgi:hypothetical protein
MRNRLLRVIAICLLAGLCHSALAQRQARLVVDNRSRSNATIQVWRYTGYHWDWLTVATVPPGKWVPVSDVKSGERFRAIGVRHTPLSRTVGLHTDPGYGGPQDVWILQ